MMLSKFVRYALTASAVAPVCITFAFIAYTNGKPIWSVIYLTFALLTISLCRWIISYATNTCGPTTKNIRSVSPADKEITNYFLTYLFPLISGPSEFLKIEMSVFFYLSLFVYISFSESYSVNPVMSFLGYKFYEAEDDTGVGFILISKKTIINGNVDLFKVVKLTEHTYIAV